MFILNLVVVKPGSLESQIVYFVII